MRPYIVLKFSLLALILLTRCAREIQIESLQKL